MAKGQRRSNREVRKPKQNKAAKASRSRRLPTATKCTVISSRTGRNSSRPELRAGGADIPSCIDAHPPQRIDIVASPLPINSVQISNTEGSTYWITPSFYGRRAHWWALFRGERRELL